MQTLILKSYDEKILAVAEYLISSSGINIKFSVRGLNFPGIHKLLLMSSLKPGNEPVIADTLELKDGTCFLERTVTSGDIAYKGYYPGDIDTFVLAGRDGNRYFSEAVGFLRFFWNVDLSLKRLSDGVVPSYAFEQSRHLQHSGVCSGIMEEIEEFCSAALRSPDVPMECMEWYVLEKMCPPIDISAYRHILTPEAVNMMKSDGSPLLFGIKKEGLTAFAHKSLGSNPFENADDCTVKVGDYYIVGIRFKEDGQYFERID